MALSLAGSRLYSYHVGIPFDCLTLAMAASAVEGKQGDDIVTELEQRLTCQLETVTLQRDDLDNELREVRAVLDCLRESLEIAELERDQWRADALESRQSAREILRKLQTLAESLQ